tara:strand:- start:5578 stop:6921 length:1344 start_codon:yes stop_codon:yes gene_type:complete
MTQINWQYQVNNRAGGYIVTNTDWNDFAGNFRALIDQTTGSGTTDNSPLPIGIDLVNDRVYISDPDSTTPENANHADTTFSVVGTSTFVGNTQQTGTFTVGVDDTGHDVIFYGATTANGYFWWDESTDALIVGPAGHLSFGETAPTWSVEFATDDDLTSFTGTNKGGVCITNSQYDANDFTALDFSYTGTDNPVARIAAKITGSGSELHFGTSNDYSGGVTNNPIVIDSSGRLLFTGNGTSMIRNSPSSGREILELRSGGTTLTDGAGYNLYGDGDSGHPSKHIWFTDTSSSRMVLTNSGLDVNGSLTKDSGSFDIAHPTKGGDWRLRHSFIEGPKCDNIYRGTVTLSGGSATVDLDTVSNMTAGTFEALNKNLWSMVSSSGNAVTWSLSGKTLTINGPDSAVCSWMVIGERKDQAIINSNITDTDGELVVEYEREVIIEVEEEDGE